MIDPALALIIETINEHSVNTLLIIDEHSPVEQLEDIHTPTLVTVITQRFDQYQALQKLGFQSLLSDYSFSRFDHNRYDIVAIRIGKQKAISHHVINCAPQVLTPNGQLILAGSKQEGLQSIAKKLKTLTPLLHKQRAKKQHESYSFGLYEPSTLFDDYNYPQLRPAAVYETLHFLSKPGLYGWKKIDTGSALLLNSIPDKSISCQHEVLDLGCGYGFISVLTAQRFGANITATDNNIAAVDACNANLRHFNCNGTALIGNCADSITKKFDTVLCNPPFHSGFNTDTTLTDQFLASARAHLKRSGCAYFVVNEFIGLEQKAAAYFNTIKLLAKAEGFKVFSLQNV